MKTDKKETGKPLSIEIRAFFMEKRRNDDGMLGCKSI